MASGDTKTEALMNALENGGNIDGIAGCCNTNLQNYIIDSIDSVIDAKDAIQNKGGTVDYDAGLTSLPDEIATIPSGGAGDWGTVTYDDNGTDKTVTIQDAYEYSTLYSGSNATINDTSIHKSLIKEVNLGTSATFASDDFLEAATGLVRLNGMSNLVHIGSGFLSGCSSFNQELDLSNVKTIKNNFL